MADVEFRDIFWQVRAELPGVPVPLLYYHYVEAVREFCTRAKAWQHDVPSLLDLGAGVVFPVIVPGTDIPLDTYLVQPLAVKWASSSRIITFKTRDQLDELDPDWESLTGSIPEHWTVTGPKAWRVYPLLATSETGVIRLRVALAPSRTEAGGRTGMPEELSDEFHDTWGFGCMSRLMRIPGKDWSNPGQSGAYRQIFEQGIMDAKSRAAADFGRPRRQTEYGGLPIGGKDTRNRGSNRDDYGNF